MSKADETGVAPDSANSMWGGRFQGGPDALMERINASIDYDQRLWRQDITGSRAHCRMLVKQGILTSEDGDAILAGLDQVWAEIEAGNFPFKAELEDIHMNVEARLKEIIGDAAGRLHTARSRNDQVATDFRLWLRDQIDHLTASLTDLQRALLNQAAQNVDAVMPGFTHLQTAQPVTFGHHMMAYVEMFERDKGRYHDARKRLNESPLGAAALAGTGFPTDRHMTAEALGFDQPMANSLDAVSARDFAVEFLAASSTTAMHLSRLAEEIVIWSSAQFQFVRMPDSFSTGSSIMPQKRNPDAAELVRAKPGRIYGALMTMLTVLKGLPLAYSKDMQEDKEAVFDAAESIDIAIAAMTGMISGMTVNRPALLAAAGNGFSTATDLADWLVREANVPFRDAHHITGRAVKLAEDRGCDLADLSLDDYISIDTRITQSVFDVLTVENSVASRTSYGGTAPSQVESQISAWTTRLQEGS